MVRPLGMPVGSVRALLLLAVGARIVLDLREAHVVAPWLLVTAAVCAAAYFAGRASQPKVAPGGPEPVRVTPPLGLPAGTIRTIFLLLVAYGLWLWTHERELRSEDLPVLIVLVAFVAGILVRWLLGRARRPEDPGAQAFDHLQALIVLACAGGLVAIAAMGSRDAVEWWVEPLLGAAITYYFGAR